MITEEDIYEHKKKYPKLEADRLIKFLDKAGKRKGNGFNCRSVKSANELRKWTESINRMLERDT
jgi:hypothetical protein